VFFISRLLNFNQRISLVAAATIPLTIIITTPRLLDDYRPLNQLKVLGLMPTQVGGDMSVRCRYCCARGGLLENSFT
jgi:hypothetical protein